MTDEHIGVNNLPGSAVDAQALGFVYRLSGFNITTPIAAARELRAGNINTTYLIVTEDGGKLILQRINHHVFKHPTLIMSNIAAVTEHLRAKIPGDIPDPARRVLSFLKKPDGTMIDWDDAGQPWRCYRYIEGATAYNSTVRLEHLCQTGRAFGAFQRDLADFPIDTLCETIDGFHDTPRRYQAFLMTLAADRVNRASSAAREIEAIRSRESLVSRIVDQLNSGALPMRVTHNDTKINNVLIDDITNEAVCVIDLDTVMPGSSLYDFGDMIRFGANTAAEDEPDLSKISLDMNKFEAFTQGFLMETRGFIGHDELLAQPLGCLMMAYEQAMRFLTDYLDGDRYYKTWSEDHNLVRAKAQLRLLEDMERKTSRMERFIRDNV